VLAKRRRVTPWLKKLCGDRLLSDVWSKVRQDMFV
jgi:hypothetical protein